MTVLVLATKKLMPESAWYFTAGAIYQFVDFNRKGVFTLILLWFILLSVAGYLGGLYLSFTSGFSARETVLETARLEESILKVELQLLEKQGSLAKNEGILLESMQRISGIKYLSPEVFTALQTP